MTQPRRPGVHITQLSGPAPVYVCWDTEIARQPDVLAAVLAGINTITAYQVTAAELKHMGSGPWADGPYGSVAWYLEQAWMPRRRQLDADHILRLLEHEPWQELERHRDFLLVSQDMTMQVGGQLLNFCFGASNHGFSVQSVYRFMQVPDRQLALKLCWLLAAHEFGHLVGLGTYRLSAAYDSSTGTLGGGHCLNLCLMQQVDSVEEAIDLVNDLLSRNIDLCQDCQRLLAD